MTNQAEKLSANKDGSADNKKPGVLLLEDDKHIIEFLTLYLEELGIAMDIAESESTFRQKLENRQYSLLIMDISLHKENGGEIAVDLMKNPETPPIVLFTAMSPEWVGKNIGNVETIYKPFKIKDITQVLEKYDLL